MMKEKLLQKNMKLSLLKQVPKVLKVLVKLFYSVAKEIYDNENNITIDDIVIEKDTKKKKDNKEKKTCIC